MTPLQIVREGAGIQPKPGPIQWKMTPNERHRKILEIELPPRRRFRRPLSWALLFLALLAAVAAIAWGVPR